MQQEEKEDEEEEEDSSSLQSHSLLPLTNTPNGDEARKGKKKKKCFRQPR